jgi:Flp pilus assembly pilin Flp
MVVAFQRLSRDQRGQDLLEYALLAALIALVAYAAVRTTGTSVNGLFGVIANTAAVVAAGA